MGPGIDVSGTIKIKRCYLALLNSLSVELRLCLRFPSSSKQDITRLRESSGNDVGVRTNRTKKFTSASASNSVEVLGSAVCAREERGKIGVLFSEPTRIRSDNRHVKLQLLNYVCRIPSPRLSRQDITRLRESSRKDVGARTNTRQL